MTSESEDKNTSQPAPEDQQALPAPVSKPVKKPQTRRPSAGAVVAALVITLLELLLPAVLAVAIVWFLFDYFKLWLTIDRTLGVILFGVAVVIAGVLLAAVIDSAAGPLRKMMRSHEVRFLSHSTARMVNLAVGGLVLPLLVVLAANFVTLPANFLTLPERSTAMDFLRSSTAARPVTLTPPDEVGAIGLSSANPGTKQLSIQVLQGFQSPQALAQLVRMVDDKTALANPGTAAALSKAIAAYGAQAKLPLFNAFRAIDPSQPASGASFSSDLYTRYFAQSFDSLKSEITRTTLDATVRDAQLAQLQAAQAQLKTNLSLVQSKPAAVNGDSRLDFILQTFLAMDLKEDSDLLAFARTTAADTRYSSLVRGDALLLVGKLGAKDDLNTLYPYLKNSDDLIQARALEAIAMLQTKLGAAQ